MIELLQMHLGPLFDPADDRFQTKGDGGQVTAAYRLRVQVWTEPGSRNGFYAEY